jgi:putative DNA primase/helicase
MTAADSPRVEAAIWYARQHFGVFPVWSPNADGSCHCPAGRACRQAGKHPITPNGFLAATVDEAKIRTFLAAASEPNIGITPPPGDFGWDVDGDVPQTLAELAERLGPLPPTLMTITGNGKHLILRWPAGVERPKGHPFGIVTRWADTGYLIGAGSRHSSGAIYRLELGDDGQPRPIAELPMAWATALLAYRKPPTAPGQPGTKIGEGQRHGFLRDSARLFRGKGLTGDALFDAVWALNIDRCSPPKSTDEVRRAIGEVEAKFSADPVGDEEGPASFPPPSEPMRVANRLVTERFGGPADGLTLRHWRGEFWRWRTSHWLEMADQALRAECYRYTEHAQFLKVKDGVLTLEPWAPNRYKVADLVDALRAVTHLAETIDMPAWLDGRDHHLPAAELVACANGLLHIPTRTLLAHDHAYFNRVAVPFDYQAHPPRPTRWLRFLAELWHDDPDAIAALAEFMGYVISGRRDLHKILLLIGPTRAGKGVIARVLKALVGRGNYAGPTLASLGTNFGLSPLIGKPLAIISDARLGGANVHQVVERLLSVSGEDMLTVDVKFKEPWTGTLPTRFLVISNELPRFGDASGAIASRFVVLTLRQSWLGRENPGLTDELLAELPGILGWVLDGLERLNARGRFTEPSSSTDAIVALADLVSPTSAFIRERCIAGPMREVPCDTLYAEWKMWAEDNGHRTGSVQTFGRDLRAVLPGLRTKRPRDGDDRQRWFEGVGLATSHNDPVRGPSRTSTETAAESEPAGRVVRDGPRPNPLWPVGDGPPDDPARDTASDASARDAATPGDPVWRPLSGDPGLARDADLSAEPPGIFDELPETVRCDKYRAHQSAHRRVGAGWVCDACQVNSATREPSPAPKHPAPHDADELGDWLAVSLWERNEAPSDGWGTIE